MCFCYLYFKELKVWCIILFYPLWYGFLISNGGNTALYLKEYHRTKRHLLLVAHFLTKLSQIVCLTNLHILTYVRCNSKLWNAFWFYCVFGYFHTLLLTFHIWGFISNKLSQNVCLINTHILKCWYAKCNCKLRKVLWFNWAL